MGVDLFFVLSGYLITNSLLGVGKRKNGYRNFLVRRALRIFPLYFLCLALFTSVSVLRANRASWEAMETWGGVSWFFVYLGNVRAGWMNQLPPVLSFATLWSLQVEEQFYFLYPIAVALLSIDNLRRFLVGCIIAAPALRSAMVLAVPNTAVAGYSLTPCRMDALAMGGLLAVFLFIGKRPRVKSSLLAFLIGSSFTAVVFCAAFWRHHEGTAYDPWMISVGYSAIDFTCASLLSCIVLSPSGKLTQILRWRAFVYTGQIAYGLYLLHIPASWLVRKALCHVGTYSALSVAITLASSFAAAAISWRVISRRPS